MTEAITVKNLEPAARTTTFMGNPAPASTIMESEEELLLNNPKRFAERVREDAVRAVEHRDNKKQEFAKFWDEFNGQNPDLKDVGWHVQSVLNEKFSEWKDKPTSEAQKLLAQEARRRIDLLRNKTGMKSEELNSTNVATLPSSGEMTTTTSPQANPTAKTFVQELIEMKRHRNKR